MLCFQGLEAQRVIQVFSNTGSFAGAQPTGLFDSIGHTSPHSPTYPNRTIIEVRAVSKQLVTILRADLLPNVYFGLSDSLPPLPRHSFFVDVYGNSYSSVSL